MLSIDKCLRKGRQDSIGFLNRVDHIFQTVEEVYL